MSRTALSVPCSLVVTCWERANLLALLYVMFSCVLSLSHTVSWVRYLIVSIPDLCILPYFYSGQNIGVLLIDFKTALDLDDHHILCQNLKLIA